MRPHPGSACHVCARLIRARGASRLSRTAANRPETYDALWKVPGQGEDLRFGLYVELPTSCVNVAVPRGSMVNSAFAERWTVKCVGGLTGGTIQIAGQSLLFEAAMTMAMRRRGD